MNTQIGFLLVLILLIILLLFYYIDLESNIIILLGVVIVLILHNIITKKEHFNINEQAQVLDSKIDTLLSIAKALSADKTKEQDSSFGSISITNSCPLAIDNDVSIVKDEKPDSDILSSFPDAINMGFNTDVNALTHADLAKLSNN